MWVTSKNKLKITQGNRDVRLFALEDSSETREKCFKMHTVKVRSRSSFAPAKNTDKVKLRQKHTALCVYVVILPASCRFRRPDIYLLGTFENPMELT